jgi:acetyl-CoA synthetase
VILRVPSYPDFSRFGKLSRKHDAVLYGANSDSCSSKRKCEICPKTPFKTLKVIGSVGEPINEEAWHWYHVGQKKVSGC